MHGTLGDIAKEITSEINIDDLNINPDDPLGSMFSGNNMGNLMGMVQKVSQKIQGRVENGDINLNTLQQEAQTMMANIQQQTGMQFPMPGMPGQSPFGAPPSMRPEEVARRERLRKKARRKRHHNSESSQDETTQDETTQNFEGESKNHLKKHHKKHKKYKKNRKHRK